MISNSNSDPFTQEQFSQLVTQDWHGVSSFFTKSIPTLYSDNSMQKYSEETTRRSKLRNRMIQHMIILKAKQERKKAREEQLELNQSIEIQLTQEILDRLEKLRQMDAAAITIQKYARGYLTRRKTETVCMEYKRRGIQSLLVELKDFSYNCFYNVGNVRIQAANLIQRAYRRTKLRLKIERMIYVYKLYQQKRTENAYQVMSRVLPMMYCKRVCQDIRYEKMKVNRLEMIKRNLAIHIIKKVWNNLSLSGKRLKRKISTYRRRHEAKRSKEIYLRHFAKLDGKSADEIRQTRNTMSRSSLDINNLLDSRGEIFTTKSHEEEDETAIFEAMNAMYMIRLNQSKTSYGVRKMKVKKMTPVLTRKNSVKNDESIESTPKPQNIMIMRQKFNEKVRAFFPYHNNKAFRENTVEDSSNRINTIIEATNNKKFNRRSASYCIEDCNYMKSTTSSIAKIEQYVEESVEKTRKVSKTSPRVLSPTVSYKSKTRLPVSYPKAERQPFIIPGINRTEFSPLPEISNIKEVTKSLRSRVRTASQLERKVIYSRPTSSSVSYEFEFQSVSNLNTPKKNHILASLPENENLFTKCFPRRLFEYKSNSSINSSRRRRTLL